MALREAKGWSQTDLAEASGVALGTIKKIERGATSQRLNFSFVVAMARALGTDCTAFAECEDVRLTLDEDNDPTHQATPSPD